MIIDNHPFTVNECGHLEIGQLDTTELAREFGTPLYIYDVEAIRNNCRAFIDTFNELDVKAHVSYASKAFSSIAILQVIEQEGLGLDVVSEGELFTAMQAGFPAEKIHFHGNNKSLAELEMAIDYGVGTIIIDNFFEIALLEELLNQKNKQINVLIRVTPGIESETHHYIMTGNEDSKFGFNIQNGQAEAAFNKLHHHPRIKLRGLHSHIGSQIFTTESFQLAINMLFNTVAKWKQTAGFIPEVMNFGGGFGIRYTRNDAPLPNEQYVKEIVKHVEKNVASIGIDMPEIWLEPGRSIVGNTALTLYRAGAIKDIAGVRKYVSVDGGMADNIRPALYEAKYEAVIANKVLEKPIETVSIAGKACESGDMLIWDLPVPKLDHDDIIAVFSTGAYGYAMASNYNRFLRPAVVFVENKEAKLVIRRESLEDIVKNDLHYTHSTIKE